MWQRFTERARRVVFFAQEEAGRLGENNVGTEHLLLGLVREDDSFAARVLDRLGISLSAVRHELADRIQPGPGRVGQDMQLTPRSKRVIDLAYDEARQFNNNYIGTEHLFLGLVRERDGVAGSVLDHLGVQLDVARAEILSMQNATPAKEALSLLEETVAELPETIRERLRALAAKLDPRRPPRPPWPPTPLAFGDLGKVAPANGRTHAEVTLDLTAFLRLKAVFEAKDAHGYRAMAEGDQTMFLLPAGTPLKLLAPPPDAGNPQDGFYVRVLSGEYEGYAGWVFESVFERTGADDAPFPPASIGHPRDR